MKRKAWLLVFILSVGLNVAFVTTWIVHAIGCRHDGMRHCRHREGEECGPCSPHRRLGTSDEQWRRIEPLLAEFRKSSQTVCHVVARHRGELIDLLAAPEVDREAVRAKQKDILAGQRKMQELLIAHLLAEKELLGPEQQEELFRLLRTRTRCPGHGTMGGGLGTGGSCPCQESRGD